MIKKLTKNDLLNFETKISKLYEDKKINHYHALLKGCSAKDVERQIIAGKSMTLNSYKNKFFTSSIVGGVLPIALGVAFSIKKKKNETKSMGFYW